MPDINETILSKRVYFPASSSISGVDIDELRSRVTVIFSDSNEFDLLKKNQVYRENVVNSISSIYIHSLSKEKLGAKEKQELSSFAEKIGDKLIELKMLSDASALYSS